MTDRYAGFAATGARTRCSSSGSACPTRRGCAGTTTATRLLAGPVLLGGAGRLVEPAAAVLAGMDADFGTRAWRAAGDATATPPSHRAAAYRGRRFGALVFDATGITTRPACTTCTRSSTRTRGRWCPAAGSSCSVRRRSTPRPRRAAIAQRALEGFTRSVGKEFGRGITAQLVQVAPGAEGGIESTLRFLLSGRSAYVSGQVIRIGAGDRSSGTPRPTGTGRSPARSRWSPAPPGASARRSRGARPRRRHVVCLDVPAAGDALVRVANARRRHRVPARPDRAGRARAAGRLPRRPLRPRRHRGAQRRHHPRQDARRTCRRGRLAVGARRQPARAAAGQRRAARRRPDAGRRPDRRRLLDRRHRRQPRPDQLRDLEGRRDRHGRRRRRRSSRPGASRSTRSRPASSRPR